MSFNKIHPKWEAFIAQFTEATLGDQNKRALARFNSIG